MTTSSTSPPAGQSRALQALIARGEPITTIRSPRRMSWPPPGRIVSSARMIAATFESSGIGASRSGTPTTSADASSSTSNSPTCTCPSANTSVCRAAGTPRMRLIAYAVSSSDETTKSTSSWPSRHSSTYSMLEVRMTVVALSASRRANIPATMFTSSRDVHAITRSTSLTPAAARSLRLVPSPSNTATSKRAARAVRREASVSSTVIS